MYPSKFTEIKSNEKQSSTVIEVTGNSGSNNDFTMMNLPKESSAQDFSPRSHTGDLYVFILISPRNVYKVVGSRHLLMLFL